METIKISLLELVRERKAQKRLENLLLEGLESGQPIEVTQKYLNARRQVFREKLERRKAE
jgi:hypothetical protein